MNRLIRYIITLTTILLVSACTDSPKSNYQELGWKDLKPSEEKSLDRTSSLGSLEIIDNWAIDDFDPVQGLSGIYSEAYSVGVVPEIDGKNIRVPGFVVPIEFDAGNLVTEFFLVPSFGSCFHRPPPPPNQTIYVTSSEPIEYDSIYDPVWIMGVIKTKQTGNDIATAAYSMELQHIEPFDE